MARQVVIVGRLVSMTRAEAARVLALTGGELAERVTRATALVVVGGRGPQLRRDGRLLAQFARARRLVQEGTPLEVVTEEGWLRSLGLAHDAEGVRKRFTAGQMADALGVPRPSLDRWLAAGLVRPVEESSGIPLYDFRQVAAARALAELLQTGIPLGKVRRAVAQLTRWLPEAERPLADLCLSEEARRLVVRMPDGRRAEPTGQLLLEFDDDEQARLLAFCRSETQSEAIRRAVSCEEEGRPAEAAEIYRQLMAEQGPHALLAFNLGNALYAADDTAGAMAQFRLATELDPQHAGAWNNLANVLAELDRLDDAIGAYRRALALDPACADAHFNLAQTLVELGRDEEAMLHWRAFLAFDAGSTWADYARERLNS